jgi:hypothetical protein
MQLKSPVGPSLQHWSPQCSMSRANLLMRQQHNRQGRGVFRLVQAAVGIKACSLL